MIKVFGVQPNEMKKGMMEWKGIFWGYWARIRKSQEKEEWDEIVPQTLVWAR